MHNPKSCFIVGAGMSGLTAARSLTAQGWQVRVIDKGRNPGGRMSTRRKSPQVFDHGAQYFTVRSSEFRPEVERWLSQGWVERWFGESGHQRYRGSGGMNALAARLAEGLDLQLGSAVQQVAIRKGPPGWIVSDAENRVYEADALVVTAPVPQALWLIGDYLAPEDRAGLEPIAYDPCIALMVKLAAASSVPAPGYLSVTNDVLAVISDNSQKGISSGPGDLTLHSTAAFAREYWDSPQDVAATRMLSAAQPYFGDQTVESWQYHRWRYALATTLYPEPCFAREVEGAPLVLAGDGFGGARIEGAYLSGLVAAGTLAAR